MKKELKEIINKDLQRIYEGKLSFKQRRLLPLEMRYIICYRKAAFYTYEKPSGLMGKIARFKLYKMTCKTHINIPESVKSGPGLYIGHLGRLVVNPDVTLGKNVNLSAGVTIGKANRGPKKGVPSIGDNVWIGTGAVIVGKITIGNDVLIAPNAYVNIDVPDHSIVIGNPAVIHKSEHATKDYINRTV